MAGIDEYTKLMLHANGDDQSTSFPDASASNHTVTAYGAVQVDQAEKKFGNASGLFDGTGDYLQSVDTLTDFDFGSGDFTIDCWVYLDEAPGGVRIIAMRGGDAAAWNDANGICWVFAYITDSLYF
jgi:hypothetical protein